ncbi:hypothetical protein KSZ_63750 [Dictyobacter formicarum]|uniref:Uncharacterized protein n=1 Tax=Dictyobacter formicarum TaxID=2778368 RepID=A0ABQ3VRN4_9CHLR|nr:hypothetical protein KSZ_63750 [Dictyobacter formicarum]
MPGIEIILCPTSDPRMATPSTLPICRPELRTAEAIPDRLAGADSITAVVMAGIVKAIPKPIASSIILKMR